MIFVSVGTERFPFNRMIRAVDQLAASLRPEPFFVQLGNSDYLPQNCTWFRFLPFQKLVEQIEQADIVISHAGAGSILLCIRAGKIPIVMPRLKRFGEHVDDHQRELARKLAGQGRVVLAEEEGQLFASVAEFRKTRQSPAKPAFSGPSLAESLAACLVSQR